MHCLVIPLLLVALMHTPSLAQAPAPTETHTPHAEKVRRNGFSLGGEITLPSFTLALDGANVVGFIPQADDKWVLKRLRK